MDKLDGMELNGRRIRLLEMKTRGGRRRCVIRFAEFENSLFVLGQISVMLMIK